jgi:hypothetical protein
LFDGRRVDVPQLKKRYRLLACAAIYACVAALAGCGGGGSDVTFHSPAYKTGYACGSGETGANAPKLVTALDSCRSSTLGAGHTITPQSDFDDGVSDGWHVRHGF